ncbi:ACP S-malonyltransferase [Nesterenkonia marinintestina]|uniref:ACP S-malonyltransferase n=1 Tax=Nesterenkonia marinintestina TaxID=2979865 RepID=UPI0021BE468B|nr:ACP S-malonyltransferase [Nesterenkonia sp. GX14115]
MLAIICPGQGSQSAGFLAPWLEDADSRAALESYSEAAQTDLVRHGTESDEDTIRDTALAQPLLVAAALLSARALGLAPANREAAPSPNSLVAGHSVGEIPAAALAGVLTEEEALRLIRVRAAGMAEAAAATPTSMAAVLGGVEEQVLEAIGAAGLTPANRNAPGQIVAAGTVEQIAALSEQPPARAKVVPLKVAGAFHTEHMAPAREPLAREAEDCSPRDPTVRLLSNRDGEVTDTGADALERIVGQVTRPVRWDLCMETMASLGVTGVLELLPGGTLTGLAKRGLRGTPALAVRTPEDLEAARGFIEEHTA